MSAQKPNSNSQTIKASYAMPLVNQEKPNVQTQNRFQILGTISSKPKPTFAQIASSSQTQQHVVKAHTMKVQALKPCQLLKSKAPNISKKFPNGKYFLQNNLEKTRKFYEFILVDTDSIEISHIQNKTSIDICYSKCRICKVISQKSWDQSFDTHKMFSQIFRPKSYDYHDYIDILYYTFFFHPFDHSWFFHWGDEMKNQNDFPNWFQEWGLFFGTLRTFSVLKLLKDTNTLLNTEVTWFLLLVHKYNSFFQGLKFL